MRAIHVVALAPFVLAAFLIVPDGVQACMIGYCDTFWSHPSLPIAIGSIFIGLALLLVGSFKRPVETASR